jgi:hypothetical protein
MVRPGGRMSGLDTGIRNMGLEQDNRRVFEECSRSSRFRLLGSRLVGLRFQGWNRG